MSKKQQRLEGPCPENDQLRKLYSLKTNIKQRSDKENQTARTEGTATSKPDLRIQIYKSPHSNTSSSGIVV